MQQLPSKNRAPSRSSSLVGLGNVHEPEVRKYQLVPYTRNAFQSIKKLDSNKVNSDTKSMNALHPQLQKKTLESMYRVNKSRSLKELLEVKLRFQEQKLKQFKKQTERKQKETESLRKHNQRIIEQSSQRRANQMEQQRKIDDNWRHRSEVKQKTQSSFILNINKEHIAMLRKSFRSRNSSERSLVEEKFRDTIRSSKFEEEKRKLEKEKQRYEHQYRYALLKNVPLPKQRLSEQQFYSTLKYKSKKLTEIYASTQHLPIISQRRKSIKNEISNAKKGNSEKQLMISSMRPMKAAPKTNTSPLNPQKKAAHRTSQRKTSRVDPLHLPSPLPSPSPQPHPHPSKISAHAND